MPKRKLSELDLNDRDFSSQSKQSREDPNLTLQTARLTQKFEHGTLTLFRALKTARGFERQKLGRREKTAKTQGNSETFARLEGEIKALKNLDLHQTAQKHLYKQLLKTKRIAESPVFCKFKESKRISKIPVQAPVDVAEANVTARLYKSNPVRNVLPDIMNEIRKLLGYGNDAPSVSGVRGEGVRDNDKKKEKKKALRDRDTSMKDPESESEGDVDIEEADADADAGSGYESVDYSQFASRLAPDSDEESNPKSNSDSEQENQESESEDNQSISHSTSPPPKKSKTKPTTSTTAPKSTTFLPSLMMGGYWSGSESPSEDETTETNQPRRKNRMGQQARRALWEKKYGARANHLQKTKKNGKESRDKGWDVRRGATDPDGDGDGDGPGYGGKKKWGRGPPLKSQRREYNDQTNNNANANANAPRGPGKGDSSNSKSKVKGQDDKPLHPSWEAARRAKEQATQVAFQGKKVVFD